MSRESRILAGAQMVTDPTIRLGGVSRLSPAMFMDEHADFPALGLFPLGIGPIRSRQDNS